jgi:hypothetical protein
VRTTTMEPQTRISPGVRQDLELGRVIVVTVPVSPKDRQYFLNYAIMPRAVSQSSREAPGPIIGLCVESLGH